MSELSQQSFPRISENGNFESAILESVKIKGARVDAHCLRHRKDYKKHGMECVDKGEDWFTMRRWWL